MSSARTSACEIKAIRDQFRGGEGRELEGPLVKIHVCMQATRLFEAAAVAARVGWYLFRGRAAGVKKRKAS